MAESVKAVAPFAWEAYQDYVVKGMRFTRIEKSQLDRRTPSGEAARAETASASIARFFRNFSRSFSQSFEFSSTPSAPKIFTKRPGARDLFAVKV